MKSFPQGNLRPIVATTNCCNRFFRGLDDMTYEDAIEYFAYDSETGVMTWKKKPSRKICIGTEAGTINLRGYRIIQFRKKLFLVHRIIMLIVNGSLPPDQVDHKNGDCSDNRFINLRLATNTENRRNAGLSKNNQSGFCGVHFEVKNNMWRAYITINWKKIHLGCFTDKQSAIDVRKQAESKYGFYENHGKVRK